MTTQDIENFIVECSGVLPHFADGRIDYTTAAKCPVINVIVTYNDRVLLLKRSDKVMAYKGKWNCIGGFLDEVGSIEDKIHEELREELSILPLLVERIAYIDQIEVVDSNINRTWLIQPALVVLKEQPIITLDWEHTDYAWVARTDVSNYDTVAGLDKLIEKAFAAL